MFCPNCGIKNDDGAAACVSCGRPIPRIGDTAQFQPPAWDPMPVSVPNYLAPAILATVFCCVPAGVAAIVYAAQANTKAAIGDYDGAKSASSAALMWCWLSFGASTLGVILYIVFAGILGVVAGMSGL